MTQEALLQQTLEKYAVVERVTILADKQEATAVLGSVAVSGNFRCVLLRSSYIISLSSQEVGKLALMAEPILFSENELKITEESAEADSRAAPSTLPSSGGGLFVPRTAASRPRAGLGHKKKLGTGVTQTQTADASTSASVKAGAKGQDDFRKMLGGK